MARILLNADAGAHTGFATVTHGIFDRLARDYGHEIHCLAINYRGDYWDTPLRLYPATMKVPTDVQGQSRMVELLGRLLPEVVVYINDPAVVLKNLLANQWDTERALWRGVTNGQASYKPPILAYLPVDGYNQPRAWDTLAERVQRVAMTHFGRAVMPEAPVIWHGVNHEVFYPRDKAESKQRMGYDPDRFLILRVDKNAFRKDYPATWRAMRPLMRRHSDIDVHFHCRPTAPDGYDLDSYTWNDDDINDRLRYTMQGKEYLGGFTGVTEEYLATLYSAADLFVSTSWGEGFGLAQLEAMACGTPVVASDHSAITEVVGDAGVLIPPGPPIATPMGQDMRLPDVPAFSDAIERLYLGHGSRRKLSEKAIAQASRFSWDIAAEKFDHLIRRSLGEEVPDALSEQRGSPGGDP